MEDFLKMLPQNFAVFWLIMFCIVIFLLIKFIPKIAKVFNNLRKQINELESISTNVTKNREDIVKIYGMLDNDKKRLNELERLNKVQNKYIEDSVEEREIILRSLLGVLQGLQEIGANGPTKKAEHEIQEHLLKKSHRKVDANEV